MNGYNNNRNNPTPDSSTFSLQSTSFLRFVYLFSAVMGLCYCLRALSSSGERGLLSAITRGLPLLWNTGRRHVGSVVAASCSSAWEIFRDRTWVPCIGRRTLDHWISMETLISVLSTSSSRDIEAQPGEGEWTTRGQYSAKPLRGPETGDTRKNKPVRRGFCLNALVHGELMEKERHCSSRLLFKTFSVK